VEKPFNLHHAFWQKSEWKSRGYTRNLRNHHATQIYLPISHHQEIHHEVPKLEQPSILIARLALDRLMRRPDNYSNIDALEDLSNYIYDKDGGEPMAIHLDRQIPLLRLGERALKRMSIY
jgi:hypothetical protein